MTTPHAPRTARRVVVALALLLAVTGCVSVPTSGPIERVQGEQPTCQICVNVEVAPPVPGSEPDQIVNGYLRATSIFQPNYTVAQQYLSKAAQLKWRPEGATIYRDAAFEVVDDVVLMTSKNVGSLGSDRTFTADDGDFNWKFRMVLENGNWRIDSPPGGLLIGEHSFENFYEPQQLYFLALGGGSLVPQAIYLPALRSPQNVASALVAALLAGPSDALAPVVQAIPNDVDLSVNSVTITDGVADVPLNENMRTLTDRQRSQLAAQVVFTLKKAGLGIKGVSFSINQSKITVAEADPSTQVMSVDAIPPELEPVPVVAADQLYAVARGRVGEVDLAGTPRLNLISGPLGEGRFTVGSLAVSLTNTDFAAVTSDRRRLLKVPVNGGDLTVALEGVTGLLRPQFTRYGGLWVIGKEDGQQRVWRIENGDGDGDGEAEVVESPALARSTITAFKISPDGTRMAIIRRVAGGSELGIARINRSGKQPTIDKWRLLDTRRSSLATKVIRMVDVAWADATDLIVLGSPTRAGTVTPIRISDDASRIIGEEDSDGKGAVEVSIQQRTQSVVIRGRLGETWRNDGSSWRPLISGVDAIAYPG